MQGVVGGKNKNEIRSIDLFITERCNMDCEYCFHPKSDSVMSLEEGKKILDRMKEISPDGLQITFFGGEPLLFPQGWGRGVLTPREMTLAQASPPRP